MPASEQDIVFNKFTSLISPGIGFALGWLFEAHTGVVLNLQENGGIPNIITLFVVLIGIAGTLAAGALAISEPLKRAKFERRTWMATLNYLRVTISISLFGIIVASIYTAIALEPKDVQYYHFFLCSIMGAALFVWSSAIFSVLACAEILFDRS